MIYYYYYLEIAVALKLDSVILYWHQWVPDRSSYVSNHRLPQLQQLLVSVGRDCCWDCEKISSHGSRIDHQWSSVFGGTMFWSGEWEVTIWYWAIHNVDRLQRIHRYIIFLFHLKVVFTFARTPASLAEPEDDDDKETFLVWCRSLNECSAELVTVLLLPNHENGMTIIALY